MKMKVIFWLILSCGCVAINAQSKSKVDFTKGWKFKLDSVGSYQESTVDAAGWGSLNLPHDWSIEGAFSKDNPATTGGGALPGGVGWYRKTFTVPANEKDKIVLVDFDGVYKNSEVWINGHSLGMRPNGYISFEYDLTPYLNFGSNENVIAVKVDNSKQPNSRWYSGSGIYRNVWLTTVDKLHVANWGTYVTTPIVSAQEAIVEIETKFQNQYTTSQDFVLQTTIVDTSGKTVTKTLIKSSIAGKSLMGLKERLKIAKPHLWSVDNPYLYKVVSQVLLAGKVVDTYETNLGIRTFNFDADRGFSLNGKPLKIRGVCNHHDLGALGTAINTRALQRQLELLKQMGCNAIRTSHNPPAPELLALCDKMGFIVMDEAFDMWAKEKTKYDYHLDWDKWHTQDLADQLLRDRNHPSVFIWSIGNEIGEQWGDEKKGDTAGRAMARELVAFVKNIDTTRPITTANNETNKWNQLIQSGAFDMIGYNYSHASWGNFHERWPGKKLIVTESTSALETRGQYDLVPFGTIRRWPQRWDQPLVGGNADLTVSAYDNVSTPWGSTHEESLKVLEKNEHVSGMFVWTGFDYLGEPTPYDWPARSSYFGIIDLAGFPKDVYYLYQSMWTNKPVLHLYPHWNWKQGDTIDVVSYYNNADEVELYLNGRSLGAKTKTGDELHIKWRVPFEAGTLKAVSRKNGKTVLTKEVKTAGAPAKLLLKADRNRIKADEKDLSFVTVAVVDKDGVVVPTANNLIGFGIAGEGTIAGVDNGSPTSHEPFNANQHTAMNGLALAIIQSNDRKGKIKLTASADGLASASVEIVSK
jgi:beta-galactosidase